MLWLIHETVDWIGLQCTDIWFQQCLKLSTVIMVGIKAGVVLRRVENYRHAVLYWLHGFVGARHEDRAAVESCALVFLVVPESGEGKQAVL